MQKRGKGLPFVVYNILSCERAKHEVRMVVMFVKQELPICGPQRAPRNSKRKIQQWVKKENSDDEIWD